MKSQLLCTFSDKTNQKSLMEKIRRFYNLLDGKFFVFENCKNEELVMLTYNVEVPYKNFDRLPSTISIHRKKQTNTLYTLNAMNRVIEEENGGVFDKNFKLDWSIYKNCLIITSDNGYRVIDIRLTDIIKA